MQRTEHSYFLLLLIGALVLLLNGCAQRTPLNKLDPTSESIPHFADDLQLEGLLTGAVRHLHYLNNLPNDLQVTFESETYPITWLRESMRSFIDILRQDPSSMELARIVRENFTIYQAGGREGHPQGEMLITGYYEPFLQGSLSRQPPYIYPLYAPPTSLIQVTDSQTKKLHFRRKNKNGELVPYWTRKEIEEQGIAAGNELVYLDNPVDAFILHIQGSGKIQLRDKSMRSIHYAASNGREYYSIGKLLVDQNKMKLAEASIPSIRSYLQEHPDEQKQILEHNKKFIFFRWAHDGPPVGSLGEPLVAGRSIAIDHAVLPGTTLAYLKSRKPVIDENETIIDWVPMERFVFPQDSGSAIKGSGRADLYWGNSNYAKHAAGNMKEKGKLYFLVKNNFEETKK